MMEVAEICVEHRRTEDIEMPNYRNGDSAGPFVSYLPSRSFPGQSLIVLSMSAAMSREMFDDARGPNRTLASICSLL